MKKEGSLGGKLKIAHRDSYFSSFGDEIDWEML